MAKIIKLNEIKLSKKNMLRSGYRSYFRPLTRVLEYYKKGELIMISGRSGSGKSTFLSQEMLAMLDQDQKIGVFSGELPPTQFKSWLYSQMCRITDMEMEHDEHIKKTRYYVSDGIIEKLDRNYNDQLALYHYPKSIAIFEDLEKEIVKGVNLGYTVFFIDNLMQIVSDVEENEFKKQIMVIHNLKELCKAHNINIFLVAHPKKVRDEFIVMDDVAGRQELFAKVDIVLLLHRISEDRREDENSKFFGLDGLIEIAKNRDAGSLKKIRLKMDNFTKRFYSISELFDGVKDEKEYVPKGISATEENIDDLL